MSEAFLVGVTLIYSTAPALPGPPWQYANYQFLAKTEKCRPRTKAQKTLHEVNFAEVLLKFGCPP